MIFQSFAVHLVEVIGVMASSAIIFVIRLQINQKFQLLLQASIVISVGFIAIRVFGSEFEYEEFAFGVQEAMLWLISIFLPFFAIGNNSYLEALNIYCLLPVSILPAMSLQTLSLLLAENSLFINISKLLLSIFYVLSLMLYLMLLYRRIDNIPGEILTALVAGSDESKSKDSEEEDVIEYQMLDIQKLRNFVKELSFGICISFLLLVFLSKVLMWSNLIAIENGYTILNLIPPITIFQKILFSWKEAILGIIIYRNFKNAFPESEISSFSNCKKFRNLCLRLIRAFSLQASEEETNSLISSSTSSTSQMNPHEMDTFLDIYTAQDENGNYIHSFEEMLKATTNARIHELIHKMKILSDRKKELARQEAERKEYQVSAAVAQEILNRSSSTRSGRSAAERARAFKPRPSKLSQKGRLSYHRKKAEIITDEELDAVHQRFAASLPSFR